MHVFRCLARCASAMVFSCASFAAPADAQTPRGPAEIHGHVIDAQTGLPLAAATVSIVGSPLSVISDAQGNFRVLGLPPGMYALRIAHSGYQPSDTDDIALTRGGVAAVTLSLQAAASGARLATIGRSSTALGSALQSASTIYRSIDPEALLEAGTIRAGDAIRGLPGINNGITGDTAALS